MAREHSEDNATQCWGQAACPLVPAALRRVAGDAAAPTSLQDLFGRPVKLADLDAAIWPPGEGAVLGKACLSDLVKALTPLVRGHSDVRVVEGGDGLAPVDVRRLALPAQTARFLAATMPGHAIDVASLTFGDLLALPRIGPRRAIELACALEAHLASRFVEAPAGVEPAQPFDVTLADPNAFVAAAAAETELPVADETLIGTVVLPPGERRVVDRRQAGRTPREIKTFFRVLAAWASGERGEQTLKNALPQPKPGWPPELVQLWKRVRYCSAPDLAGNLRDRYSVPDLVQQAFAGCDQRHRLILQARVLTTAKPTPLEALAEALCVSVDDVRALQRAALGYLERLQTKPFRPVGGRASLIRQRLGCAVPERDAVLKQALDWVVSDFVAFPDLDFARELMLWLAGPYRLKDHWFVTSADLPIRTVQALLGERNRDGVIETSVVRKVLSGLAIHPKYHEAWIDRVGEFIGVGNGLMCASDRVMGQLPAVPPR